MSFRQLAQLCRLPRRHSRASVCCHLSSHNLRKVAYNLSWLRQSSSFIYPSIYTSADTHVTTHTFWVSPTAILVVFTAPLANGCARGWLGGAQNSVNNFHTLIVVIKTVVFPNYAFNFLCFFGFFVASSDVFFVVVIFHYFFSSF